MKDVGRKAKGGRRRKNRETGKQRREGGRNGEKKGRGGGREAVLVDFKASNYQRHNNNMSERLLGLGRETGGEKSGSGRVSLRVFLLIRRERKKD